MAATLERPAAERKLAGVRLVLIVVAALALAGCGSGGGEVDDSASLLLDFTPNAVHTGIYVARARGFDTGEGVRLGIRVPSSSTDAARLLASGRVDFAVLDIHDLGLARERGRDLVGVMALVQRPLASVIALPGTRSPRALEGRRVGVTGVPSDTAVLRSIVSGAGGDPRRVRTVTIGFQAVTALLARRVAGATAFWNVEGVALRRRRPGYRVFRVDEFGAPSYPELVLCATRRTVRERPDTVSGVVRALRRGYEQVLEDPEGGVADLLARARGDRVQLEAELGVVQGAFRAPDGRVGELDRTRLRAWARWDVRFGILRREPDLERAFELSE
jgi:putative hydroxymethylpyrimidine transport system substrate-binding protein